ncbi:type IV secretory system conjugative DNA transfer family protein [Streptomyces sp. H10-C2]|uniref:type IV secretory system conjugative DNA transfer family protein n=1 Tax=unclassified Streptomyces TaxID=2593676 RepID=UPI0024BA37DF|nr:MULTISPECIES: type IV secretory system conjugative DNA transfer family protein [unclassified Streptomyces]MDJ0345553.1 type IV secretory system conjugative DNA transfer family protein [Streptomyces sp. PH10-H1]MDJ0374499.1 type IV secretory system conjugative DNA transfer family protein [Streptomyces sp. H10-C2]
MTSAMPDLHGLLAHLPGGALTGGGAAFTALVLLAVLANQSGKPGSAERKAFNEGIERRAGAVVGGIGRYVSGRDLTGPPRSESTWWKAGAPLPDDEPSERPVEELGAHASSVSLIKATPLRRSSKVTRAVTAPVRAVWRLLVGVGHVLAVWHRWPRVARSAVRLAPLPLAWGLWRYPDTTPLVLLGIAGALIVAAVTGPAGLDWWRPREWTDEEILAPGVWVALRQILRMEETEARNRWLSVSADISEPDARIVLRVPVKWMGGPEAVAAIERVIDERMPGDWVAVWQRTGTEHYARWTLKPKPKPIPRLPESLSWKPTGDPSSVYVGQAVENGMLVDAVVQTKTATPHWGVAGDTGSGKSTVLYIPVVHGRQNGELIDILDTKRNSLREAEGFSGVRVHKTTRACISAFGEFLTSMMAAEAAVEKGADPALRRHLVPRTLVVDELPTLIKMAYTWWRHGLKAKGSPPFLDWLGIILLQGRSSDHRVVVGTQQFANSLFGGTMERAQIGARFIVGGQDRVSWGVAFGQSTPVLGFDTKVKGRGAYSDKTKDPNADYLYVREFQASYITPDVARLLAQCPQAPGWFDRGEMAPWITPELLAEVNETAGVMAFLPGGKYGPVSLPPVASGSGAGETVSLPSSQHATGPGVPAYATGGATGAVPEAGAAIDEEALPETFSLAEAFERGIVPWKASTVRTYGKRGIARGITFPEGVTDGQTSFYTEAELTAWLTQWRQWQERNGTVPRQETSAGEPETEGAQRAGK